MTNEQKVEEAGTTEDGHASNVVPFRRQATGGSGPPSGTGGNWLAGLEMGQRFLAKRNGTSGSELEEFVIAARLPGVVLLAKNVHGSGDFSWHDSSIFSRDYRMILTLEVINDDSKSIQPSGMAGDAEPEIEPSVHEE